MPAFVNVGCVRVLKLLKDNVTFWIGVGKTTPWNDDDIPPEETVAETIIADIQGLKKADVVEFVKESLTGEIVFFNKRYTRVSEENIYEEGARWLHVGAWLNFDQFPVVDFRQSALFVDVVPLSGYENREILLPNQVQSYGIMLGYVNHHLRRRVAYGKDFVEMVVELEGKVTSL